MTPAELAAESERLFLADLLVAPDGVAPLASAPAPYDRTPFPDGGKWRGAIPCALVRRGLIAPATTDDGRRTAGHATRPTRHRSWLARWRLIDPDAAAARLAELSARRHNPTLFDDCDN